MKHIMKIVVFLFAMLIAFSAFTACEKQNIQNNTSETDTNENEMITQPVNVNNDASKIEATQAISSDSNDETNTKQPTKKNKDIIISETRQSSPTNNTDETSTLAPIIYDREQQASITLDYYLKEFSAKGWIPIGTSVGSYWEDGIFVSEFEHIVFPAPPLADGQVLYTTTGWKQDARGEIVIATMVVFDEGAAEGKLVDMYYAINVEGGPVVSAEHFDFQILSPDDENLWNYLLSQ